MKKINLIFLFLALTIGLNAQVDSTSAAIDSLLADELGADTVPPDFNTSFMAGEYVKYKVKYGWVSGGVAEMQINVEQVGYDWLYHVKAIAKTTGAVGRMFWMHDRYESYINIETGLPVKAIRDIREEDYRKYNEVLYFRKQKAVSSLLSGMHKVPDGTLDILSAFYYARRYLFEKEMKPEETIPLTTFFDDEIFIIKLKFKKKEIYKTKFGKIECLKFVLLLKKNSPFDDEDDMEVWFSNDGNYIPVRIKVDAPIGSLKCDLESYTGLKNPLGIKK